MLIKEYRVILPFTVEEYHVGQLYCVAKASKTMSNKKERVEILVNEPYEKGTERGQYTKKIYHIGSRVPGWIRWMLPAKWLQLHEEAWNAYPVCKTVLTTPAVKKFEICVETIHAPGRGEIENIHHLEGERLAKREIVLVDIANDPIDKKEYREEEDPKLFKSAKTGRGPLVDNWIATTEPVMCAYKLVSVLFKVFGFQGKMEKHIHSSQATLLRRFHRQVFCWMDEWIELSMADIRELEERTKAELDKVELDPNAAEEEDTSSDTASASGSS